MRSVSQQRPYQQVAAKIRQRIVETPYRPGGRLPPEREMAGMLNVSRTVVREALIMLEIEGLIEVRRGAGIYVTAHNSPCRISAFTTMPARLSSFRRDSCWKAISRSLPPCRRHGRTSSKCVRLCCWKNAS